MSGGKRNITKGNLRKIVNDQKIPYDEKNAYKSGHISTCMNSSSGILSHDLGSIAVMPNNINVYSIPENVHLWCLSFCFLD